VTAAEDPVSVPFDLLGALLDAVADRIARRIATAPERERYSSRELPPRTTRRRFAEVCRSGRVLDARRIGHEWECSRAGWEAARARRPTKPPAAPDRRPLAARADALLTRAGLRVVGGKP
jgi:hypothetical protein